MGEAGSAVMEACFYWQVTNEIGRVIVLCYNKDGAHNGNSTQCVYKTTILFLGNSVLDWKEIVQVICRLVVCHNVVGGSFKRSQILFSCTKFSYMYHSNATSHESARDKKNC